VSLNRHTRSVVAAAVGAGLITVAGAAVRLAHSQAPTTEQILLGLVLSLMIGATWKWPLLLYRGGESEAFNVDEGILVIMSLLLPAYAGILVFAVAAAIAEIVRRHSPVKAFFNWGQIVAGAGLGLSVTRLLAPWTARPTVAEVAAAALGALAFAIVNGGTMAALGVSLGTPWREALDGIEIRLRLALSCIAVALLSALAISAFPWSLPLALLPFFILRQVLAGHFQARHDRTRLLGLFNAALEANRSLGDADPLTAILASARNLLRCPDASVTTTAPGPGQLGAAMAVNGEPYWLVVSGRSHTEPFDAADKTLLEALAAVGVGALTNAQLYREGRFQRERLAAITSSLGEGVCALDSSARITFANPAAAAMLGWDAPSGPGALGGVIAAGGNDPAGATPEFLSGPALQVIQSGATLRDDDAEWLRSDGSSLPVAFTASAILDEDLVAGAVIVFRDISERREAETAIRVARDQAIEASRLKSQFLANMSHEIRTPMNGVVGLCRILLDTEVDDTQRKYLLALQDCGENLMVIMNDILDFSKIEAGKLDLEDISFDVVSSLSSVTNAMAISAHDKGLALRLDIDPALPQFVRGDPVRFRQIVTNLVGNAIKFTPAGSITITAAVRIGGRIRISVTDTGIGIDPAARSKVLSAFGQADSSTTRRYGGTGLGLAICSHLVGMMGGVLDFVSQPGQGSTFWFEVPLRSSVAPAVDEPLPAAWPQEPAPLGQLVIGQPGARTPEAIPGQPRILVADDAPTNRLVAVAVVERLGYGVDAVTNGEEALKAVQQMPYAAVLMDCLMPEMDGLEATRRIRQLEGEARFTQIIAMTASTMVGDREDCLLAGMDDYLSKPLKPDLLAAALKRACQASKLCLNQDEPLQALASR